MDEEKGPPWEPCAIQGAQCDGEKHRGWDGHDPFCEPCPRPRPKRESFAHRLLGEFCACYGEAFPAPTCRSEAKRLADWLEAQTPSEGDWPRLTFPMIQAAAEAHYGKARVERSGGPDGISMAVNDQDWTFTQMMRRAWPAMKAASLLQKGSDR